MDWLTSLSWPAAFLLSVVAFVVANVIQTWGRRGR